MRSKHDYQILIIFMEVDIFGELTTENRFLINQSKWYVTKFNQSGKFNFPAEIDVGGRGGRDQFFENEAI